MKCQICQAEDATLHIQQSEGSNRHEAHLCASCAAKRGVFRDLAGLDITAEDQTQNQNADALPIDRDVCPMCGKRREDIVKTEIVGCSQCYFSFADSIRVVLQTRHGALTHRGRKPHEGTDQPHADLTKLKAALRASLKSEDYESAARIRDTIALINKPRERRT